MRKLTLYSLLFCCYLAGAVAFVLTIAPTGNLGLSILVGVGAASIAAFIGGAIMASYPTHKGH